MNVSIRTIFDALNEAFSLVHTLVSHTRKIDQSAQDTINQEGYYIIHLPVQTKLSYNNHTRAAHVREALPTLY